MSAHATKIEKILLKMNKLALFLCVYANEEEKYQKILEADRKIGRLLGTIRKIYTICNNNFYCIIINTQ